MATRATTVEVQFVEVQDPLTREPDSLGVVLKMVEASRPLNLAVVLMKKRFFDEILPDVDSDPVLGRTRVLEAIALAGAQELEGRIVTEGLDIFIEPDPIVIRSGAQTDAAFPSLVAGGIIHSFTRVFTD